jgi:hypothetical protein
LGNLPYGMFALLIVAATFMLVATLPLANASYTVKSINVTMSLSPNTSAQVTEIMHITISNESVKQYSTNRVALNLTLSEWQQLIGPSLVQHIINPNSSVYDFKFLPGPVVDVNGQHTANIILAYSVNNVTFVSQVAPREYQYRFNSKVFNFAHGVSGEVLSQNTTLKMVLPTGASIVSVYPIPDLPVYSFTYQYKNVTEISWLYGEPLSAFTLVFDIRQSLPNEVESFFAALYKYLGIYSYVIIAGAIVLSILYIYRKAIS